jgi:hypothetical protein
MSDLKSKLRAAHVASAQTKLGLVSEVMQDADVTAENIEAYRAELRAADLELAAALALCTPEEAA